MMTGNAEKRKGMTSGDKLTDGAGAGHGCNTSTHIYYLNSQLVKQLWKHSVFGLKQINMLLCLLLRLLERSFLCPSSGAFLASPRPPIYSSRPGSAA